MFKKIIGVVVLMELMSFGMGQAYLSFNPGEADTQKSSYKDAELNQKIVGGKGYLWGWKRGALANDTLVIAGPGGRDRKLKNGEIVDLTEEEKEEFKPGSF